MVLRMRELQSSLKTETWRLLCVLLLWNRSVPTYSNGTILLFITIADKKGPAQSGKQNAYFN